MMIYNQPDIEIILFESSDLVRTSVSSLIPGQEDEEEDSTKWPI